MKRLLTCLALAACAAPAAACGNDIELPWHEYEFRSSYGTQPPPRSVEPAGGNWLLGSGAGLLVAAAALALTPRKK
jgi:hypothetical protein